MINKPTVLFICPFNLKQNTGTPIRLKTEIGVLKETGRWDILVCSELKNKKRFIPRSLFFWCKSFYWWWKIRPEIVHAVSAITFPVLLAIKICSLGRTKIVLEVHGLVLYEYRGPVLFKFILNLFDCQSFLLADKLIVMAYSQKEIMVEMFKLLPNKLEVIWGPIGVSSFINLGIDQNNLRPKRVCYTGNNSFWQGVGDLVEAAKLLEDKKIVFDLYGVTEWPGLLPSNLYLKGKVGYDLLPREVVTCDIFVSPRLNDETARLQYPQKLSFYLAAGKPIIVSNVGDQAKIVKENGLGGVYESGQSHQLATVIRDILSLTEEEREVMGQKSRQFAIDNVNLDVFAKKVESVYNRLL